MIMMQLNKYEINTLSSFSKIDINNISPLKLNSIEGVINFKKDEYLDAYDSFIENKFLVGEGDNVTVANELESAFLIIHQPEVVVSFKRLSQLDIKNEFFCFKKGFGLQYSINNDSTIHNLIYPHVLPSVGLWIRNNIFIHNEFEEEKLSRFTTNITVDETVVLNVIMSILKDRVELKKEKLAYDETVIKLNDLKKYDNYTDIGRFAAHYMNKEKMKLYMENNKNVDKSIESLVNKGFIEFDNNEIVLTILAKQILDPGKILDSIVVTESTLDITKISTINVKTNGYIVLTTDTLDTKSTSYKFEVFPHTVDIQDLIKGICPNAFKDGFGNELLFKKKLEESKQKNTFN